MYDFIVALENARFYRHLISCFDYCIVDKGLDNVKKIEKLKRKRKQENTSRKRRKGIANDKEGKCTEAVEDKVARNHCCSIENVESENQGVVEIEKIQAAEVKEKATLQSRSLPEVTSPRRNVVVLLYFDSIQCFFKRLNTLSSPKLS